MRKDRGQVRLILNWPCPEGILRARADGEFWDHSRESQVFLVTLPYNLLDLARNIYHDSPPSPEALALVAGRLEAFDAALIGTSLADIVAGKLPKP